MIDLHGSWMISIFHFVKIRFICSAWFIWFIRTVFRKLVCKWFRIHAAQVADNCLIDKVHLAGSGEENFVHSVLLEFHLVMLHEQSRLPSSLHSCFFTHNCNQERKNEPLVSRLHSSHQNTSAWKLRLTPINPATWCFLQKPNLEVCGFISWGSKSQLVFMRGEQCSDDWSCWTCFLGGHRCQHCKACWDYGQIRYCYHHPLSMDV